MNLRYLPTILTLVQIPSSQLSLGFTMTHTPILHKLEA